MEKKTTAHRETLALHSGYDPMTNDERSIEVPLYVNTAFAFKDSQHAKDVFELKSADYLYTRLDNPTTGILSKRLAAYEGGVAAVCMASGQGAHATTFLTLLRAGDHIVASSSIYGGTFNLLNSTLPRLGIRTTFVDISRPEAVAEAICPETKLVFCETLGNPKLDVTDVRAIAEVAHRAGLPLFVDNTLTSGIYHPIDDGADVVTYSLTKYVCGQGTTTGGAVIDSGNYDWSKGPFDLLRTPCASYHDIVFTEAFGKGALATALTAVGLRDLGCCLSPYAAFDMIRGLGTLEVRMERISRTTAELADWLEQHPLVEWVRYPSLRSHERHDLAERAFGGRYGGILTFGPKGGYEVAKRVTESVKMMKIVANLGDTKSLITHPASTTHNQLTPEEQHEAGISPDLIRLAIGLEHVEDIKADIEQALEEANRH